MGKINRRIPKEVIESGNRNTEQAYIKYPRQELIKISKPENEQEKRVSSDLEELNLSKKFYRIHTHVNKKNQGGLALPSEADLLSLYKASQSFPDYKGEVIAQRDLDSGKLEGYTFLLQGKNRIADIPLDNELSSENRNQSKINSFNDKLGKYYLSWSSKNSRMIYDELMNICKNYDLKLRFVPSKGYHFSKKSGNFEKDLGLEKIVASILGVSILLFSLFNVVNINGFVINNSEFLSSINLIWILIIVSFLISFFIIKNLEDIKAIVIPTGNLEEDLRRSKVAIDFVNKNNLPKRCIIAGLGPDTNLALGYDKTKENSKLDFHKDMYDYLMKNTDWTIGVDVRSLNSIENILETFPKGTEGRYAIVSYPLHIKRIKTIVKDAKRAGKISKDLEFVYIPTKQDLRWVPYEVLSNLKYHSISKNKYFNKKQQ